MKPIATYGESETVADMNDNLPVPLQKAQQAGIEFFMAEDHEWKLEIKGSLKHIEKAAGSPVLAFANNGFGDHLFLKKPPGGDQFDDQVFEFFHEGPEINRVAEPLDVLLGLKERPPSTDPYPKAIYDTGEMVQLGDKVQVKVWAEFWKGWQDGQVEYVPGVSKRNPRHEYNGLKWVAVRFTHGEICPLVDPKSGKLRKVKFLARGSVNAK